jgi:hypothetical protein
MEEVTKLNNGLVVIHNRVDNHYYIWTTSTKPNTMDAPYSASVQMQVGKALGTCIRSYDTFDAAVGWAESLQQDSIDKFEYIASITPILVSMQQESVKLCVLTKEYVDKGYGKCFDDIFMQHTYAGLKLSAILEEPVFGAAKVEDLLDGLGMTKGSEGYNKSRTRAANKAWGYNSAL